MFLYPFFTNITGFDAARLRQIMIRDVRNLSQTQKTLELDCSTGILMPLFDPDTNMLFLAGKGDTTILYMELTDREPFLIEGLRHSGITIFIYFHNMYVLLFDRKHYIFDILLTIFKIETKATSLIKI